MSRVIIILLNWNGWRDTVECLESLQYLRYDNFRIVVCDNGSSDDSVEQISAWGVRNSPGFCQYKRTDGEAGGNPASDPFLTLICVGANLGFAGGNNVGIRYGLARGNCSAFWLLNNDTTVEPDALCHLVARLEQQPAAGLCGSTLIYYQDREKIQALGGGYYFRWIGLPWHYGRFSRWTRDSEKLLRAETKMNYVEGASMLVSYRFIEMIGLLEEDYFLYFEEADWAIRAKGRFALAYAPQSVVYHKIGGSIGTSSNPGTKSFISDFYNIRNRLLFTRRYFPAALPTVILVIVAELLVRLFLGKWDRVTMIMQLLRNAAYGKYDTLPDNQGTV